MASVVSCQFRRSDVVALIPLVWVWTFQVFAERVRNSTFQTANFGKLLQKSDFITSVIISFKAVKSLKKYYQWSLHDHTLIKRRFKVKLCAAKKKKRKDFSCDLKKKPHTEHREMSPKAFKTNSCMTLDKLSLLNGICGCPESLTFDLVSKPKDVSASSVGIWWKWIRRDLCPHDSEAPIKAVGF